MLDRLAMPYLDRYATKVAQFFIAKRISANAVTVGGFCISLVGCVLISQQYYVGALVIVLVGRFADAIDGAIARSTQPSAFGAYLDIVCDFIFYSAFVAAFAIAAPAQNAVAAAVLLVSFMATASSFLAFAVHAAKDDAIRTDLPKKGIYYLGGLCEGTETHIIFALMLIFPNAFPVLAYLFAIACWITFTTRVVYARSAMRANEPR